MTDAMDDISISDLSTSSSRSEQMAYLTTEAGLDPATADLMYRAERLQEKGKLKLALKYFEKVLQAKPDCTEAKEHARVTEEMIALEQVADEASVNPQEQPKLPTISEEHHRQMSDSTFGRYTVTEMDIKWTAWENIQFNFYPEPQEAAFSAAKAHLNRIDHGRSLIKLLKNEVQEERCDIETGWETLMQGLARFQVTLIPDRPPSPATLSLQKTMLANMMHLDSKRKKGPAVQGTKSGSEPSVSTSDFRNTEAQGNQESTSHASVDTSSRFADADNEEEE